MKQEYTISEIKIEDLEEALCLVEKVFLEYEAPDYAGEGIKEFMQFIEHDSIKQKFIEHQFRMWTCTDNKRIIGVLAIRPSCHISLLFVDGEYHRKGIARAMFSTMVDYYQVHHDFIEITVNSSPYAIGAYHKLGFSDTDVEQTINGIRFIPMIRPL